MTNIPYNPEVDSTTGETLRSYPTVRDSRTGSQHADSGRLNQKEFGSFKGYEPVRLEKVQPIDDLVTFEANETRQSSRDGSYFDTGDKLKLNLAMVFIDPEGPNLKDDGEPRRLVCFDFFTIRADWDTYVGTGDGSQGRMNKLQKQREEVGTFMKDICHRCANVDPTELMMDTSQDDGLQELFDLVADHEGEICGWEGHMVWQATRWQAEKNMGKYKKDQWYVTMKPLRLEG